MEAFLEKFQHDLKVFSFEEIKSITGDFDKNNLIGEGGFGQVYKGVVDSDSKGQIMVAFKRLDRNRGQGILEFLKEIQMLSQYRHENLVSLLGFCNGVREKILVYEHAAHGSLDEHLSSTTLTWPQCLNICLGAAKGLCYLHDPKDTHERVIHRDIKSANFLLDENWNAKIADMGLSKRGSANQGQSFVATNVVGTVFYADPEYMQTSILTKESDVYSFGVVLFEVLCGSLCFEIKNGIPQKLVGWWTQRYEEKKLEEIIFHHLKQGMDLKSSETYSEIAYECLVKPRAQRPSMIDVVTKLENALHSQQEFSKKELEEMVKAAVTIDELEMLLSKTFLNNKIPEEIVKAALIKREEMVEELKIQKQREVEEMVKAAVSIEELEMLLSKVFLNNKIPEEIKKAALIKKEEMLEELKIRQQRKLKIRQQREVEEMVKAAVSIEELEMLLSKAFLNNKISEEMIKGALKRKEEMIKELFRPAVSREELQMLVSKSFINKEEQELFLSKGVLVNGGNTWFSVNKNGDHSEMISGNCFTFTSLYGDVYLYRIGPDHVKNSRFKLYKQKLFYKCFKTNARAHYLSPGITYTVNLVFKLEKTSKKYEYLRYTLAGESEFSTSFIQHEREDGWMMTDQLCHFISDNENVDFDISFDCEASVLVEGIEIQSLDRVQHEQVLEEEEVDTHPDTYWEQKLPNDWEEIVKSSKDSVQWTTKKELYSIFCKGFLINSYYGAKGVEWFSLANNGKNCHMYSARGDFPDDSRCDWKSLPESRFGETACDPVREFKMSCRFLKLSPETTYAAYLVYKLQENHSHFEFPVYIISDGEEVGCYIYLLSPEPPGIRGKVYQKKRIPQQRNDGWMEVPVYEFQTDTESQDRFIYIKFKASDNRSLKGLIMEGMDFRPI